MMFCLNLSDLSLPFKIASSAADFDSFFGLASFTGCLGLAVKLPVSGFFFCILYLPMLTYPFKNLASAN